MAAVGAGRSRAHSETYPVDLRRSSAWSAALPSRSSYTAAVSFGLRQALFIAVGGLLLLILTAALARRQRISLRYAIGWTMIALFGIVGALLTPLVEPVSELFGMSPTGLLLATASVVLLSITILLSVSVSGLQTQVRDLAESHALLERQVHDAVEFPSTSEMDGL
jgi:uncharacterized membrane protein